MNILTMRHWLPALLGLCLLAGCRSEQVAFDFAASHATGAAASAAPAVPAAVETELVPTQHIPFAGKEPAGKPIRKHSFSTRRNRLVLPASAPIARALPTPDHARWQATIAPRNHGAAQARPAVSGQGLGRIFFLLLAVVAAVLTGLAFAAAAIFNIGFWAALGYVVAGIVVLLLLRALVKKMGKGK